MKKLLVLALVLGVVGLASAGTMTANQLTTTTGSVSGSGYTIDGGSGGGPEFAGIYVGIVGAIPTYVVNYPGDKVDIYDVTSSIADAFAGIVGDGLTGSDFSKIWDIGFADTTAPPNTDLPNGTLITYTATGAAKVYVLDSSTAGEITGSELTFVPEPVTLALLGLGGLFIRRRK
jgi:hypothetical protein